MPLPEPNLTRRALIGMRGIPSAADDDDCGYDLVAAVALSSPEMRRAESLAAKQLCPVLLSLAVCRAQSSSMLHSRVPFYAASSLARVMPNDLYHYFRFIFSPPPRLVYLSLSLG